MKKIHFNIIFSFLLLSLFSFLDCLEKRQSKLEMKTSIIVPCYYKHFYLIHDLLRHFSNQIVLPDEIIISISESDRIAEKSIADIEEFHWPFVVKILRNKETLYGGGNRNKACEKSTGDLLICHDADDIPHPQKVKIIKFLFENYKVDHLLHTFIHKEKQVFKIIKNISKLLGKCHYMNDYEQLLLRNGLPKHCRLSNGQPAIRREVFDIVQWCDYKDIGEDKDFNKAVYKAFKYKVILDLPLIFYRKELSAYDQLDHRL